MKNLIAYKGTKNFKCRGQKYEIGKTYEIGGDIKLCERGFHFCKVFDDVNGYYSFSDKDVKVLEIEILGDIIDGDDKSVTNKLKIIREIPKAEWNDLSENHKYDEHGNRVWSKDCYGKEYFWEYKYDEQGNVIWEKNWAGREWFWKYDERGNMIWKKDCYGNETNITIS